MCTEIVQLRKRPIDGCRFSSSSLLLMLAACQSPLVDSESPSLRLSDSGAAQALSAEPTSTAGGIGDPYFPNLGNEGYDVQHYKIVLDVDPATNHIQASTTVDAIATLDLASFQLDLRGLEVHSVQVDGREAEFRREEHELIITPVVAISAKRNFSTTIRYSGTPQVVPLAGLPIEGVGWTNLNGRVFTWSEPHGSMGWYPCNNHQRDKASHEFHVTVPAEFTVAANGMLQSVEEAGDRKSFHFLASDPMATYLATINIAHFEVEHLEGPGGLPLTFYFPPKISEEVRMSFRRTPELIATLSEWFGPYPFESYGGVVVGGGPPAALETQTLPVYGGSKPELKVQIHELAHQWFGNSVSFDTWKDLWLAESFASYAEWMWESTEDSELDERIRRVYAFLSRFPHELAGDPGADHLFGMGVYVRGPIALHALRLKVGDEDFFETLQTWTKRHRGSVANTADFIALSEEVSGHELSDFFDAWLYQTKMPDIPQLQLSASDG